MTKEKIAMKGVELRELRLKVNLTQQELSQIMGLTGQVISRWEKDYVPIGEGKKNEIILKVRAWVHGEINEYGKLTPAVIEDINNGIKNNSRVPIERGESGYSLPRSKNPHKLTY